MGSIFRRFWDGSDHLPVPNFDSNRLEAERAARRSISVDIPWDILGKADARWTSEQGTSLFDGSYLTSLPSIWAKQQYGIVCSTQLANHIHTSFNNLIYHPKGHHDREGDVDMDDSDDPEELTGNGLMLIFLMMLLQRRQPQAPL